jgi:hypothetical protein
MNEAKVGSRKRTRAAKDGGRARAVGKGSNQARRHAKFAAAAASRLAVATTADDLRPVTFSTGSNNHFLGITAGLISGSGPNAVSLLLPVGSYPIHWRVTGSGAFTLTAAGAALAAPISSVAPDAGPVGITVA